MSQKRMTFLAVAFVLTIVTATQAWANVLTSATATANCQGYSMTANAADLTVGVMYTISYSFTLTCDTGSTTPTTTTISGSIPFTATASTLTATASGTFGGASGLTNSCQVSGSATMTGNGYTSTVYININGTNSDVPVPLMCSNLALACPVSMWTVGVPYDSAWMASGGVPPYAFSLLTGNGTVPPGLSWGQNGANNTLTGTPTTAGTYSSVTDVTDSAGNIAIATCPITISPSVPTACVLPPSGTAIGGSPVSWNGFTAPAGSVVWINAHLDAKNVPTNTITTVDFTGVTLVVNATSYALPNGQVVFNPAVSTPTTIVNADGSWTTTVNPSFNNDIFFVGQAIPVDSNMENGGHGNTGSTLSFSTNSSDSDLQFQWQWGAAVYTSWPGNANADIEPVHANQQAGAPLNPAVQADLIQGPRGGGGSNFTGSWSGTGQGTCP